MVGYRLSLAEICAKVDEADAERRGVSPPDGRWRSNAAKVVADSGAKHCLTNESGFWSEIKQAFIDLQGGKCAYCERKIGSGKVEWDIEHYRPKNAIQTWPGPEHVLEQPHLAALVDQLGSDSTEGYFLLAYNLANYAASCKFCNSTLKWTYFPVKAVRQLKTDDAKLLAQEKPLIIFPVGDWDDDPESLIEFDGPVPIPVSKDENSFDYLRASVTIDLFRLRDREDVLEDRCEVITQLWVALTHEKSAAPQAASDAALVVRLMTAQKARQGSCARSYVILYRSDPARARKIFDAAIKSLEATR